MENAARDETRGAESPDGRGGAGHLYGLGSEIDPSAGPARAEAAAAVKDGRRGLRKMLACAIALAAIVGFGFWATSGGMVKPGSSMKGRNSGLGSTVASTAGADRDEAEEGSGPQSRTEGFDSVGGTPSSTSGDPSKRSIERGQSSVISPGSSSGTAGGGGNSGSSGGSKPSHTHDWVAQTEKKWVQDSAAWDEQVWVQDSAAWTETVQTGEHIQCSCGATFNSNRDWSAHNKEQMITTGQGHRYSVVPTYEQIYHEAAGHYETVHHEAAGHYETATTGYKCSGCGAKK